MTFPNTIGPDGNPRGAARDADGQWTLQVALCPGCDRNVIVLRRSGNPDLLAWPRNPARPGAPPVVPAEFADDYREACTVLPDSPKASAALGRRCLQHLLREKAKVKPGNLNSEIDEVIRQLPIDLADSIDAIRVIGNFSTHPMKDTNTGEVLDVEPGEAEWILDVLEGLFDHYFVRPATLAAKRSALDAKLQAAAKPPLKKP